ncbi:MAG: hypothetical protein A2X36_14520 [Elusimicrobia bacterium GWA2_69_24]|nr:MAG: hypothetical protein A2X36_14520 [Elusimicrobia bacterium GWA2_69_24]HBL18392.1 hypothetical protein [Elusimicrobiota bacterium]
MSRSRRPAGRRFGLSIGGWLRTALGLALMPTAVLSVVALARSFGDLAQAAAARDGALRGIGPFVAGFAGYAALHLLGIVRLSRLYVLGHELTHAAAVWAGGGKVYRIVVASDSGRVDLSHMSAFVALAPYWIPFYGLVVAGAYRLALWAGAAPGARGLFLALMGAALSFHWMHTVRSLWVTRQSDLDQAGLALSLALIALLNALVMLAALKCLFPVSVSLAGRLRWVAGSSVHFWSGLGGLLQPAWGGP